MTGFRVTDRLSIDFTIPANFFLETKRVIDPQFLEENRVSISDLNDKILLNYTMKLIPDKVKEINGKLYSLMSKQGYITDDKEGILITEDRHRMYAHKLFKHNVIHSIHDEDKNDYRLRCDTLDVLDLKPLFTQDNMKVIEYCKKYHLDFRRVFHFDLFENNMHVKHENTFIDWDELELFNFNVKPDCTYHILFYKSNDEYNRILDRIREKEKSSIASNKEVIKHPHTDIFRS